MLPVPPVTAASAAQVMVVAVRAVIAQLLPSVKLVIVSPTLTNVSPAVVNAACESVRTVVLVLVAVMLPVGMVVNRVSSFPPVDVAEIVPAVTSRFS